MNRTVAAAARAGKRWAPIGLPDLRGFRRRAMAVPHGEVEKTCSTGWARSWPSPMARASRREARRALYNQAARDQTLARAVARGTARADPDLILVGLASSAMREAAEAEGLRFAAEAFADRAYQEDGSLRPRTMPEAVITDPRAAAVQAVALARDGEVRSANGASVRLAADTLCVHGDNPSALANARAVRAALLAAGSALRALAP